jgi:prevent-host-death family protein
MKTVSLTDLRRYLSDHLRFVRSGEEIVIVSRGMPLARILPIPTSTSEEERRLVAAGVLRLPEKEVKDWNKFWDEFFALPGPNLSQEEAMKAVLEEREGGR